MRTEFHAKSSRATCTQFPNNSAPAKCYIEKFAARLPSLRGSLSGYQQTELQTTVYYKITDQYDVKFCNFKKNLIRGENMKVVCILEAFDKFESVAGRRFCYNLQMSVGHFYLDISPRTYPPPPGHFPARTFPSLFTWCRTFPPTTMHHHTPIYKAIYRN